MFLDYYIQCKFCENITLCFDKELVNVLLEDRVNTDYLRKDSCQDYEERKNI